MKLYHYLAKSRVFGSVQCDYLGGMAQMNSDGILELDPHSCADAWDREQEKFDDFLQRNADDLAKYAPDCLQGKLSKLEPMSWEVEDNQLYLHTHIVATQELSEEDLDNLKAYILGQYSDGWGEGLEQREVVQFSVDVPDIEFEPANMSFGTTTHTEPAFFYVHVWKSGQESLEIGFGHTEEVPDPVPQEAEIKIAASLCVTQKGNGYKVRNVYVANCRQAALIWLDKRKDVMDVNWHMEQIKKMAAEEGEEEFYITTEFTGETTKALPRLDVYRAAGSRLFTYRPSDGEHFPDRVELNTETKEDLPHNLAMLAEF